MAENSKIEWTDHTFNPWRGCTKVSPGCANCYAEALSKRWGHGEYKRGVPREKTSEENWKKPVKWNRDCQVCASDKSSHAARRPRVFCASLADWLDAEVPIEWLADLLKLIHGTPNLDWLLLTKRPENWNGRIKEVSAVACRGAKEMIDKWLNGHPPSNTWIGTTIEDQLRMKRHGVLMKIPATVHFWSVEPMLEELDCEEAWAKHGAPNWVICGGESGRCARPMQPDWARSLRDQCEAARVAFFFKQWGEWGPVKFHAGPGFQHKTHSTYQIDGLETIPLAESRLIETTSPKLGRIGKHRAGRRLDGREWNDFPR